MVDLCNERGGGDKRNWVLVIREMMILYIHLQLMLLRLLHLSNEAE